MKAYDGEFFLESEIGRPAAQASAFHVIPFGFEASVSYEGGTADGPQAILEASQQLELFDGVSEPGRSGIFTRQAIDCGPSNFADPTNPSEQEVNAVFSAARKATADSLEAGAVPVILGGEHSISYGPIKAAHDRFRENIGIVQIDAHADLRLAYEGKTWSHASVMRRCSDDGIPLLQLGVRGLCMEEVEYREQSAHVSYFDASELVPQGIDRISLPDSFPPYVYLTIDVDGLDPSIMPATGTPVPGGLLWYQTLSLIQSIASQRRIVAMDMVELAPMKGYHAADYLCAQLLYNSMGFILRDSPAWEQV